MRFGYSLLLREFLEAEELDFGDTEQFQVTCPVCREPVFKKERRRPDGGSTHFLSHFRAGSEAEKDCELRVASVGREHLAPFSAEGRGQTLQGFLAVLKDAIIDSQSMIFDPVKYRQAINRVQARPIFADFLKYGREVLATFHASEGAREQVADMIGSFPRFQAHSKFWHRRQAAYVLDVIQHLLTPPARQNLSFLAAAAFVNLGWQVEAMKASMAERDADGQMGYDARIAADVIAALVAGKSESAIKKLAARLPGGKPARTPQEAARAVTNTMVGIKTEFLGPAIGILASVPFPELARNPGVARMASMPDPLRQMLAAMEAILAGPQAGPGPR